MELSVRACVEADEAAVELLPAPDATTRRKLFGLTHAGALIETSLVTLCAEQKDATQDPATETHSSQLAGFASFDDQVPATLARWPEVPPAGVGGVVLAVHVGVDVEDLGVFSQVFSCYDAVGLSTGGLLMFYRAVRTDYTPSVFVRQPLSSETEIDQIQTMVKKNEETKRHAAHSWFDAATAPSHVLTNQDEHRACFVAQCVDTQQPCGLLACTDSIDTDQVDAYARLFSDMYRRANPISDDTQSASPEPAEIGGPPNIIVLGPTGAGKGTQSKRLVREFGVVYVCTGDLLRDAANDASEKYADLNRIMNAGDLIPDDIVQDLVLNRLMQADCKARGWLLEGYPRTDTQARVLTGHGAKPDIVAILELSDDDASQRDGEGDKETKADNTPAPVGRRLALYREHREAVRQNFVKIATVIHVDAAKSRETTTRKLVHDIYRARGSRGPIRVRNPPRLIITGAPASGKGTQCELLVRALHVVHLSTGDMLRQAIREGTSLGKQAQGFMDGGQLVPDELIVGVVLERLEQPDCKARGWLLDGFPRTEAQAHALLEARIIPDCVLALDVPDDEVVKRIAGRRLDPETGKTYHVDFNPPPPEVAVVSFSEVMILRRLCARDLNNSTRTARLLALHLVVFVSWFELTEHVLMNPTHQTRASLFLANVFEHYKDKDCVLLCLPESFPRPAITSGFRFVRGDPSISTIARLRLQEEEKAAANSRKAKHKHDKGKHSLLYAFHRDELPFLANYTLDLGTSDDGQPGQQIDHVVVKGMGVKGFGLTVKSWTNKCAELLGLGGKKEKKVEPEKAQSSRPRAVTSESAELATRPASDGHAEDDGGRNTIH
ncbi:hypothetical protein KRP22_007069 [Phytophthora ramorum]|nr:Adenylate kinase, chloroplastic [Phytophthora ramorum]